MPKALIGLSFGKKTPPKFASEGEPNHDEHDGEEPDAAEAEMDEHGPGGGGMPDEGGSQSYDEHKELALDDMADILGVSPEDRKDFGSAMTAFFHASMMSMPGEAEEPEGGSPEGMEAGAGEE